MIKKHLEKLKNKFDVSLWLENDSEHTEHFEQYWNCLLDEYMLIFFDRRWELEILA